MVVISVLELLLSLATTFSLLLGVLTGTAHNILLLPLFINGIESRQCLFEYCSTAVGFYVSTMPAQFC